MEGGTPAPRVAPDRAPRPVPDGPPEASDSRTSAALPRPRRQSVEHQAPARLAPLPERRPGGMALLPRRPLRMGLAPLRGRVLRWVPGRIPLTLHAPGKAA